MILAITVACLVGASSPGAVWVDATETSRNAITLSETGDYTIWVWAPRIGTSRDGALVIDGESLKLPRVRDDKSDFIWYNLGTQALKAGDHTLEFGERVASVVFALDSDFRPEAVTKKTRVYSTPEAVRDRRAQMAKHTDTVFTFPEYTLESWDQKAARLRVAILTSSGLFPLPEKTPLNAKVFGRVRHEDYSVEKVSYEAWPGYLVTGNLYRPVGDGPFPAVYSPHGHWEEGRLVNTDVNSVPGRGITLAGMGAVTFVVDMVGYNDSMQFEHRWSSNELKLWGIHPFALQLWGGIRGLDFLQSLPDVDPERLGVTGASGGGTQTFALMAVDDRVKVAAPVNMISSTMQGGCICENAPLIRFNNSNMEIGAMMAPRPLLMVSTTGDWTRETPHVEHPAIRSIYQLYNAENNIENVHLDYGHNYNKASREAMYRFFGKHLIDPSREWSDFTEPDFEMDSIEDLRIFGENFEGNDSSDEVVATIQSEFNQRSENDLQSYTPALNAILGTTLPESNDFAPERVSMQERGEQVVERWVIRRRATGDAIPAILYRAKEAGRQDAVVLVSTNGKKDWFDPNSGELVDAAAKHISDGNAVLLIDTFLTGEHHSPYARTERTRIGGFMDTFQPTDTAYRVQDVITAVAYIHSRRDMSGEVSVEAKGDGRLWATLAKAVDRNLYFEYTPDDFSIADDDPRWADEFYLPSILSIGGWKTISLLATE
ncbi:MAG: acetylxylan esterase [Candidatus Hydrogenedentota bacterium]